MKKLIALILTLVLILSMSICVSAVDYPAGIHYYVKLNLANLEGAEAYDEIQVRLYCQPEELADQELGDTTSDAFKELVANTWDSGLMEEIRDNVYGANILPYIGDDVTGNFAVAFSLEDTDGSESGIVYMTEMLNFNNGKNTVEITLYEEAVTCEYLDQKVGYTTKDSFFVYGTRGNRVADDVISVDLEWGGMEFIYSPQETLWNPETHEYEPIDSNNTNGGWSVKEGSSNHIAITNHSNIPVQADLSFTPADGKTIHGTFNTDMLYCDSAAETAINSPEKAPTDSTEFQIIRSELTEETAGELGTITITIRRHEA